MDTTSKIIRALLVIALAIIIIGGLAFIIHGKRTISAGPDIQIGMNCNFDENSSSADYALTISAKNNYQDAVKTFKELVKKYNGDIMSLSNYVDYGQYTKSSKAADQHTADIQADIALKSADQFMADAESLAASKGYTIQDNSYQKTAGSVLKTHCIDDLNRIQANAAMGNVYLKSVPAVAIAIAERPQTTNTTTTQYYPETTLDTMVNNAENSYNQIGSWTYDMTDARNSLNILRVSLTIRDFESSEYMGDY